VHLETLLEVTAHVLRKHKDLHLKLSELAKVAIFDPFNTFPQYGPAGKGPYLAQLSTLIDTINTVDLPKSATRSK
jgi:hypothetical protein